MEYCDDGDLFQKITEHQKSNTQFQEETIWKTIYDVISGLKALHDLKILHRDMKSANIFMTKEGVAKLGDMNVSKVAKKGLLYTQTGTPYYASPEVWEDKPYDNKSDIWSLGCVIYQMCALKPPFRASDMEGLYKRVIKGNYAKISKSYSFELHHLLSMLLQVDPSRRPSCCKIQTKFTQFTFEISEQLLSLPMIRKRIGSQITEVDEVISGLMNTIRIPRKLNLLPDRLPKPNYNPLKMRLRENNLSALSLENKSITSPLPNTRTNTNNEYDPRPLPQIKRKIIEISNNQQQRDNSKDAIKKTPLVLQEPAPAVEERLQKRKRSVERILEQRNDRIRMIYGQARHKKSIKHYLDDPLSRRQRE